ncbi:MAG TPA: rhomboid family intramembrane serine protease [Candidatus Limnocylindria bacterium]|nr:rhomboid family intramembrane serine protease [Candidatus Limnocylindria bacterium]
MTDEPRALLCATMDRRVVEQTTLVLTALAIPHDVEHGSVGWRVFVRVADEAAARQALEEVRRERSRPAPVREAPAMTLAGVHAAVLLAAVYLWVGPRAVAGPRFRAGEADARAILDGEWWRAVTALTVHADGEHLLGNAVFAALFIGVLGGALGTGTALCVTLLAGTAGNLLNAWLRAPLHQAVGASTAVFGAVGALSGIAFRRRRVEGPARAWLALGAGLALLAMLGSSVESDIGAHLFGFAAGVPLGHGAARLPRGGPAWQAAAAVLALVAVGWSWRLALG